jgi:NADH-ubiquinone oxidoreductase chain 3
MTSTTFFIIFIPILAILLLAINLILAPHNPYQEKDSVFECGFHSFLGQNRTQFSVSFFIFALLFLLFDLEILLVYPYSVSTYTNDSYGLTVMMIFFVLLTLGFVFELGKNALTIDSRQFQTPQAPSSAPVPHTPSGAHSTTPRSAQSSTALCQIFPSWARYSDLQAAWPITQTTRCRRPRASGRHSSRQSNSAFSARKAPSRPAPARTISTTLTQACTRAAAAKPPSTRQTTNSTQAAGGQRSGTRCQALLASAPIPEWV